MDVTNIAAVATGMAEAKNADALNIAVLKKALDIQKQGAAAMINAVAPMPVTSTMGQTINTSA